MSVRQPVIFLDDGGVLSDNSIRAPQWQRLVGEFFPLRLGGTPELWARANRIAVPPLFPKFFVEPLGSAERFEDREERYLLAWLEAMCEVLGVAPPPQDESLRLAREAEAHVLPHIDATFPGAPEAVRRLAAAGFELHTASGESSPQLAAYLGTMGIRQYFGHLFGPDLVDCLKLGGPEYYERVFAAATVDPRDAVVIDDNPDCLEWAAALGAATVHITPEIDGPGRASTLSEAAEMLIVRYSA